PVGTVFPHQMNLIALAGGAATASYASWPLAARAQQAALPAIGFLHLTSHDETRAYLPDFHQGLAEAGYVEGKNVLIDDRWGEGRNDRMPSLIADLVRRQVSVIVTLESTFDCARGQAGHQHDPDYLHAGRRPGANRPGREPQSSPRKSHRHQPFPRRGCREAP